MNKLRVFQTVKTRPYVSIGPLWHALSQLFQRRPILGLVQTWHRSKVAPIRQQRLDSGRSELFLSCQCVHVNMWLIKLSIFYNLSVENIISNTVRLSVRQSIHPSECCLSINLSDSLCIAACFLFATYNYQCSLPIYSLTLLYICSFVVSFSLSAVSVCQCTHVLT